LDNGAKLATTLGNEDTEIKGLVDSANKVTTAFASQHEALGGIFDNLDSLGVVLRRRTTDINTLLTQFSDVQHELENLLVSNRDNIDASISGLDKTLGTLAANRKNLGKTLHSLPLGIMSYHQTSSWGEYFNVRITKLLVQDSNSNDLVVQGETDNQHGDDNVSGKPKTGDPCVPCKDGSGSSSSSGSSKDNEQEQRGPGQHDSGAVGIESILRFVLSGAER
jgi:ABC-type transporter Mla subunit MlaD